MVDIDYLQTEKENFAILRSKAVGEPPLMYGIGAFFAIRDAIKAFNPSASPAFSAPFTPEKVLLSLYPPSTKQYRKHEEEVSRVAGYKG